MLVRSCHSVFSFCFWQCYRMAGLFQFDEKYSMEAVVIALTTDKKKYWYAIMGGLWKKKRGKTQRTRQVSHFLFPCLVLFFLLSQSLVYSDNEIPRFDLKCLLEELHIWQVADLRLDKYEYRCQDIINPKNVSVLTELDFQTKPFKNRWFRTYWSSSAPFATLLSTT